MSVTILQDKTVKTRKAHKCEMCYREFPPGSELRYQTNIYEGQFNAIYTCLTCAEIMKICKDPIGDGFWASGDIADSLPDRGATTPEELLALYKTPEYAWLRK